MTEIEVRESEDLILPTGELVDLQDAPACAHALTELRALEARIREAKQMLTDAVVQESKRLGSKTIPLAGGLVAEVKGGPRSTITGESAQRLEEGLRKLGCPEDRIRELIVEEVSYTVKMVEAKRMSVANPVYADLIEDCKSIVEDRYSVNVRRR